GTRLDEDTRRTLARGERVREVLKQPQYATVSAPAQVVTLLALTEGLFDRLALSQIARAERDVCDAAQRELPKLWSRIELGEPLSDDARRELLAVAARRLEHVFESSDADG